MRPSASHEETFGRPGSDWPGSDSGSDPLPNLAVYEIKRRRCAAPGLALPVPGSALGGSPVAPAPSQGGGAADLACSFGGAQLVRRAY